MKIATRIAGVRAFLRTACHPVVLVPTMGALHAGHLALIQRARKIAGRRGTIAVSIFVNPTQFAPGEDLSRYPRPVREDNALTRAAGVDLLFRPGIEEIYDADASVFVDETVLSTGLCGKTRPGHFRGVCTVVAKLFHIFQPDTAIFGEKDWQQLAIVRRMVRDLHFPVRIHSVPTARETDGLAISSRNRYLSPEERADAPRFHAALAAASRCKTPSAILKTASRQISAIPGARIDYIDLVDAATLEPLRRVDRTATLAAAIFLGKTRLIDNLQISKQP